MLLSLSILIGACSLAAAQQPQQKVDEPIVCDCGFQDESNHVWANVWHADYSNYATRSMRLDRNYMVMDYTLRGATENDYARAFKHNNVRVNNGTIQLTVKNEGGKHSSGSFATRRDDFLYGTYRAYMKTSNISGTVAAFFFYRNRTAEIDIETLSRLQNPWKTYLAVQPQLYNKDGSAAPETSDKHILAFNPTTDFHEYRFDWLPGSVTFYVDGHVLNTMTTNVPDSAGRIIVSHWTDGNPNFSGGPPSEDAQLTIANMTMFFNSSRATNILSCEKAQNACKVSDIVQKKMIPGSDFSSKHHHSDAPRISVPFMTILLLLLVACI